MEVRKYVTIVEETFVEGGECSRMRNGWSRERFCGAHAACAQKDRPGRH